MCCAALGGTGWHRAAMTGIRHYQTAQSASMLQASGSTSLRRTSLAGTIWFILIIRAGLPPIVIGLIIATGWPMTAAHNHPAAGWPGAAFASRFAVLNHPLPPLTKRAPSSLTYACQARLQPWRCAYGPHQQFRLFEFRLL